MHGQVPRAVLASTRMTEILSQKRAAGNRTYRRNRGAGWDQAGCCRQLVFDKAVTRPFDDVFSGHHASRNASLLKEKQPSNLHRLVEGSFPPPLRGCKEAKFFATGRYLFQEENIMDGSSLSSTHCSQESESCRLGQSFSSAISDRPPSQPFVGVAGEERAVNRSICMNCRMVFIVSPLGQECNSAFCSKDCQSSYMLVRVNQHVPDQHLTRRRNQGHHCALSIFEY
mmetsp:Transcript_42456/g.69720  ORF Transcript_42456/g.69720 Transcript_42456/m.69720 type:complete len:227 (+) Transcript_42456:69-749(+)